MVTRARSARRCLATYTDAVSRVSLLIRIIIIEGTSAKVIYLNAPRILLECESKKHNFLSRDCVKHVLVENMYVITQNHRCTWEVLLYLDHFASETKLLVVIYLHNLKAL